MKVYAAINAVQRSLSHTGIAKTRRNTQGSGYNFRGIDDVYQAVAPLLAEHGLCIVPRFVARTCEERQSKAGGALFYVTVEAEFDFISAEDGSKHTARTFGEAMDSGDKATNKAMSAAYKYAAFQTFAIPIDGNPDADAETHVVEAKPSHAASGPALIFESLQPEEQDRCRALANAVVACGGDMTKALFTIDMASLDAEMKTGVWYLLDSKTRSAIKAAQKARDESPATAK